MMDAEISDSVCNFSDEDFKWAIERDLRTVFSIYKISISPLHNVFNDVMQLDYDLMQNVIS